MRVHMHMYRLPGVLYLNIIAKFDLIVFQIVGIIISYLAVLLTLPS